jgi:CheY-like chemotaxis protein
VPKTILIADDSSTIRKIVELTFTGTDIRVEAVESGEQALEHFERTRPDLIMADVVMPGPTGYEVCKHVKQASVKTPVVLLSSTFEPYDHDLALECGADRHLVKPFESGLLTTTVRELLEPPPPKPAEEIISKEEASDEAARAARSLLEETYASIVSDEVAEAESGSATAVAEQPHGETLWDERPQEPLDERLVDAVARAVVERLSEQVVREIAAEVVPELAERIIRERIRQLESDEDS